MYRRLDAIALELASLVFDQWVKSVSFSPDGKTLAVACSSVDWSQPGYFGFEAKDSALRIFSFPDLKEQRAVYFVDAIGAAKFSPNGKRLALSRSKQGGPGELVVLDSQEMTETFRIGDIRQGFGPFAFSPDSTKIAASGFEKFSVGFFQIDNHKLETSIRFLSHMAFSLTYAPDGKQLAFQSQAIHLLDLVEEKELTENQSKIWGMLEAFGKLTVNAADFSPDGKYIAINAHRGSHGALRSALLLWDREKQVGHKIKSEEQVHFPSLAMSPDGNWLAIGTSRQKDQGGRVHIFSRSNQE